MRRIWALLIVVAVAAVLFLSSIFIVDERERALVLQFGQIRGVKEDPGLAFKIPLIQQVVRYDDRILALDTQPTEVTPSDDRRLVIDAFARYRIANVVQFRQANGVRGLEAAEGRLEGILNAQVRAVLGAEGVTSNTILSSDRSELMARITQETQRRAEPLGLQVIDVRLKQTALPEQNLAATFERMRAERQREATDERARGEEAAQRVRASADRTQVEIVSDARRQAEIIRGQSDAARNAIFADAFSADVEFFEFYRSLNAYRAALQGSNSSLVLSPDSEFFSYLKSARPGDVTGQPQAAAPTAPAGASDDGAAAASIQGAGSDPASGTDAPAAGGDAAAPQSGAAAIGSGAATGNDTAPASGATPPADAGTAPTQGDATTGGTDQPASGG